MDPIINLESRISSRIYEDNKCTTHFNYQDVYGNRTSLEIITHNPEHNQSFLLGVFDGQYKEQALRKALEYLDKKDGGNNFTVIWRYEGEDKDRISYFYGKDMREVLEKIYFQRNRVIVYECKLNPIS